MIEIKYLYQSMQFIDAFAELLQRFHILNVLVHTYFHVLKQGFLNVSQRHPICNLIIVCNTKIVLSKHDKVEPQLPKYGN